mmetsp:Transcript_109442/g.304501  ORF Transcript_109442/g.304501 Transcript_109442/m.304501 type:complete len:105 (-) Transcript_109442:16-330(-)
MQQVPMFDRTGLLWETSPNAGVDAARWLDKLLRPVGKELLEAEPSLGPSAPRARSSEDRSGMAGMVLARAPLPRPYRRYAAPPALLALRAGPVRSRRRMRQGRP